MSVENPSVLYVEQALTAEQKERVCLNIGAQPTVAGKGLSSNDYTDAEKTKLSGIESGAEANVKPDWSAEAGSDAEILNKPTIPTVDQTYDGTSTNAQSGVAVASAISGLSFDEVPPVTSSADGKVLKATYDEGTGSGSYAWDDAPGLFEAVYGTTTYSEIAAAVAAHKIVYCKALVNNANPSPQYRMAFLAYIIPSGYEFQYYRSKGTHSDSEQGDQMIIYKVSNNDTWSNETRKVYTTVVAGTNMSSSYKNNTLTLSATMPTVDQTYDGTSTNAQSGTAVASAISGIADVPAVGSSDNGKVLKATYSGGAGSYSWQPESGGGGGGTYMAGDGIDISAQDVISVKTDGTTIHANASGELEVIGGGGGGTYTAGEGIDISAQNEISAKVDGTSITVNASHELTTSAEANVIEGVKLDGAASVLTPDASKNVTIPNAVATGETGATNGLMTADDKKALGTAVQYKVNPLESGTPVLLAQQMYVVESDAQIISIAGQSSEIQGKGTIFFRVGV